MFGNDAFLQRLITRPKTGFSRKKIFITLQRREHVLLPIFVYWYKPRWRLVRTYQTMEKSITNATNLPLAYLFFNAKVKTPMGFI